MALAAGQRKLDLSLLGRDAGLRERAAAVGPEAGVVLGIWLDAEPVPS